MFILKNLHSNNVGSHPLFKLLGCDIQSYFVVRYPPEETTQTLLEPIESLT